MSGGDTAMSEDTLLAFADGKLSANEAERVARWLEAHPERADELAQWRRQTEAIGALYGGVVREAVPTRLNPHAIAGARRGLALASPRMAAAAVVLVLLGGALGWLGRDTIGARPAPSALLIGSAVTAHSLYAAEKRHAVEVAAAEQDHLVKWLSNRIDRRIDAPDLSPQGFALVGGRLLPATADLDAGPAAQLMYENADAARLTVYITAGLTPVGKAYEFASYGGHEALYWADELITCTVVSELPRVQMEMIAREIYRQLSWPPAAPASQ